MGEPSIDRTGPLIAGLSCGKSGWYSCSRVERMSRTSSNVWKLRGRTGRVYRNGDEIAATLDRANRMFPSRESCLRALRPPDTTPADDRTATAPGPSLLWATSDAQ